MALQNVLVAALMASSAVLALPQPLGLPQQTSGDIEALSRRGGGAWTWSAANKIIDEVAKDSRGLQPISRRGGGAWTWSAANRVLEEAKQEEARDLEPLSRRGGGAWTWSAANKVIEEATGNADKQ